MHDQRTSSQHGTGPARPEPAPAWVLVLGAVLLGLALLLTAYGPTHLEPVATRPAGLVTTASGN